MIRSITVTLVGWMLIGLTTRGAAQEAPIKRAQVTAVYGAAIASDADIDPQDNTQRLLLLLPRQPLVVHLDMTINGEPFRRAREKLVDILLKAADTDGDGTSTWDEGLANPRFGFGRLGIQAQNKAAQEALLKRFDIDGDGLIERSEARQLLTLQFAGGAFSIANSPFPMQSQTNLRDLLDTDKDKVLSADEWTAAAARLKSRDTDDDDAVTLSELGGGPNMYASRMGRVQPTATQLAVLLSPGSKPDDLFKLLVQRYGEESKLHVADLPRFIVLDKDRSGEIDRDEVSGLAAMLPHIALTISFGGNESSRGIAFQAVAPSVGTEQQVVRQSENEVLLNLSDVNVRFTAMTSTNVQFNFSLAQAKNLVEQLDTDKNGYLDEKESSARGGRQQFVLWDENGDGKVYAEEIKSSYELQQAPLASQIQAIIAEDGDALFPLLDTSGDGRLSLRELGNTAARLKTLDKNDDGRLDRQELPTRITVSLGLGAAAYQRLGAYQGQARTVAASTAAPDWFVRMDRNGDGDLTLREFLGTPEQFKKLDVDNDGFIDAKEAAPE
jgi:Ca2+-binding EF-hand superfamily protein